MVARVGGHLRVHRRTNPFGGTAMADRHFDSRRLQEVGTGEYAEQVYTTDMWRAAVALGRAFLCTSARLTTDVTNTHIVGHVANTNELPLGYPLGPGQSIALYIPLGLVAAGDGTFAVYVAQEAI